MSTGLFYFGLISLGACLGWMLRAAVANALVLHPEAEPSQFSHDWERGE